MDNHLGGPSTSTIPSDAPQGGLRVLSFDGGGVRGKASLILLKEIMDYVGQGAKPCDFFDLIAGTSTGGLIALMLARLQYSVADAIKKYDELGPQIFCDVAPESQWARFGTPLVDEGPAEKAFREIGLEKDADGYVDSGNYDGCKCLVTTVLQDYPKNLVPIRSYPCNDRAVTLAGGKWKIWEAARAATAAPVYFRPLEKGGKKFIDAGAGYNNPSAEVLHEIKTKIPEFKDRPIACFVSIGTGVSPRRPAPGKEKKRFSLGLPNFGEVKELVHYLGAIASNTAQVHREMLRTHMPNGPYFRFDPGSDVGAINLADVASLPGMEYLVRDHIQNDEAIDQKLQHCAKTLQAASPRTLQALLVPIPEAVQLITPAPSIRRSPAAQKEWLLISELLEDALDKPHAVPAFFMIFSFSVNLNSVMETLEASYYSSDASETTRGCILFLVNKLICNLWLTELQVSKLDKSFIQKSEESNHTSLLAHQRKDLSDSLQNTKKLKKAAADLNYSLPIHIPHTNIKELAQKLAEALSFLEDDLRRKDAVGECVRWLARSYVRDFLSFPERVKHWVLHSVLHAEPEDMRKCYHLFYKVAKRSRDLYNFSAARAIMSALNDLERLRKVINIEPKALRDMMSLDFTWLEQEAKDKNQPYLNSLEDKIVDRHGIAVLKLVDSCQQIHWDSCQKLHDELKEITSKSTRFISPLKYVFGRDQLVAFMKQSLTEVKVIDLAKDNLLEDAIKRYRKKYSHPVPPLWQEQLTL